MEDERRVCHHGWIKINAFNKRKSRENSNIKSKARNFLRQTRIKRINNFIVELNFIYISVLRNNISNIRKENANKVHN